MKHEGVNVRAKLGDHERDSVGHQPGNKMHVARKPVELCDGDGAARGACFGESGGKLRPTIERIATLARFDLDEFAYDVEPLGLGESSKAFALRFDAEARSPCRLVLTRT
jgi:hypothetical protein